MAKNSHLSTGVGLLGTRIPDTVGLSGTFYFGLLGTEIGLQALCSEALRIRNARARFINLKDMLTPDQWITRSLSK